MKWKVCISNCLKKGFSIIIIYHSDSNSFDHLDVRFLACLELPKFEKLHNYALSSTSLNDRLYVLTDIIYCIDNPLHVRWILKMLSLYYILKLLPFYWETMYRKWTWSLWCFTWGVKSSSHLSYIDMSRRAILLFQEITRESLAMYLDQGMLEWKDIGVN